MRCELLNVLGHLPQAASSAEAAMTRLTDEAFDVLLTDVTLPGKSGIELAREATGSWPSLHVIFSSGYGSVNDEKLAALSLPKPYSIENIIDVLAIVARERNAISHH